MRPVDLVRTRAGLTGLAGAAATVLVAAVDPGVPGRYPLCPFLVLTGHACPLCGGLRGTHALLHGDLAKSWGYNQILVPLLLGCLTFWLVWLRRTARREPPRAVLPGWAAWAIAVALTSYTVARNMPALGLPPLPR